MKKCIIIRGVSGSGKSTVASQYTDFIVCSTDDFFMQDGEYKFNPSQLGQNHQANFNKFVNCVDNGENVIVDNTNTMTWEYEQYLKYAYENGYDVTIYQFIPNKTDAELPEKLFKRNVHNVPMQAINAMIQRFEPVTNEIKSKYPNVKVVDKEII